MRIVSVLTNEEVKAVWNETIKMIEELDPGNVRHSILPYRANFIYKLKGLKFAMLYPRMNWFLLEWKEGSEWWQDKVSTIEKAKELVNDKVKNAMKSVM